jgi:hypothetical protein
MGLGINFPFIGRCEIFLFRKFGQSWVSASRLSMNLLLFGSCQLDVHTEHGILLQIT